ncbi:MAG: hypothetical protein ACK4TF_00270 [Thermodesulfovibrionales bacterium]
MELLRRLAGQYLKAKKFERVKNNRLIKLSRSRLIRTVNCRYKKGKLPQGLYNATRN